MEGEGHLDKGYIAPEAALKKLRVAKGLGQAVYIYGATGYGKTELVRQYLSRRRYHYISCAEDAAGLMETAETAQEAASHSSGKEKEAQPRTVMVVDDMHLLKNAEGRKAVHTYTGAAIVPETGNVTVELNGKKIDSGQYTITVSNNIHAGTATVTVTATAAGDYSGSASTTFFIEKTALTIKANDQAITYGESITEGTDQVTAAGLCIGDTLKGITLAASTGEVPGGDITPSAAQIKNGSNEDVTANYDIVYETGKLTISYMDSPAVILYNGEAAKGWYNGDVVITADGYTVSDTLGEEYKDSYTISAQEGTVAKTLYFKDAAGHMSGGVEVTVKFDLTPPTGEIAVGAKWWQNVLHFISFGNYAAKEYTVTIKAEDKKGSGISKIEYAIVTGGSQYTDADTLKAANLSWKEYNSGSRPTVPVSNSQYVVYARLTDKVGNVTYISTDGILLDNTPPTVGSLSVPEDTRKDVTAGFTFTVSVGETVTGYKRYKETNDYNASSAVSAKETMPKFTVKTPVISPAGGSYTGNVSVTITCASPDAEIYYTTDGSAPGRGSTRYTGAFTVTAPATVKAIAVKEGLTDSAEASVTYTKKSGGGSGSGGNGGGGNGNSGGNEDNGGQGSGTNPGNGSTTPQPSVTQPTDTNTNPGNETAPGTGTTPVNPGNENTSRPGAGSGSGTGTPAQGTKQPFIKGEDGKTGWDVIRAEEEKAEEGSVINVDMNGSVVVPGDIFDSIKGKDITITFDMGNGILWSVDGKSITTDKAGDIDFSVKSGVKTVPVDIINNVTGESYSIQISLAHEGELGFTAVLSIGLGKENAGYTASLYYYNESTGELEFICKDQIAEDGTVSLAFTHASDYVIAIDGEQEEGDGAVEPIQPEGTDGEAGDGTAENSSVPENPGTGQTGAVWWIMIVILLLTAAIGAGVFVAVKKKGKDENGRQ